MLCIKCKAELPEGAVFCHLCGKKQTQAPRKHRRRSNGSGSVMKLSGKRSKPWMAKKNMVYIGTYATRAEAEKALERLTDADINDKYNLTFAQVYERWKAEHERQIKEKTMKDYVWAYSLCPQLHGMTMRKILRSDYQAAIIKLEMEGKSKGTCQKLRVLFSMLARWAKDEGITLTNPAERLNSTAKQLSTREIFLEGEIEAIKKAKSPAKDIALILISCGCRPGELFQVPLSDCYEDHFIGGSKTEAGENRVIPIGPDGIEAYTRMREAAIAKGGTLLIDGYKGSHGANNFGKRDWKKLRDEIGRPDTTPYNCRHTFITRAIRAGVPLPVLEAIVGHVSREVTRLYTHLQADDLVEAVSGMEVQNLKICNKSTTNKKRSRAATPEKLAK